MPLPEVPINREANRRWINRHLNVQQDLDELITVWKPATGSVFENIPGTVPAGNSVDEPNGVIPRPSNGLRRCC